MVRAKPITAVAARLSSTRIMSAAPSPQRRNERAEQEQQALQRERAGLPIEQGARAGDARFERPSGLVGWKQSEAGQRGIELGKTLRIRVRRFRQPAKQGGIETHAHG